MIWINALVVGRRGMMHHAERHATPLHDGSAAVAAPAPGAHDYSMPLARNAVPLSPRVRGGSAAAEVRVLRCAQDDNSFLGAYGLCRAPTGSVAQRARQSTASPHELPMPDEGRTVRITMPKMRVQLPPTRFHYSHRRNDISSRSSCVGIGGADASQHSG
jgi:hypothetical protein